MAISRVVSLSSFGACTIDITVCAFSLMSRAVTEAVSDWVATACIISSLWAIRAANAACSASAAAAATAAAAAADSSSYDCPCGGGGGGNGGGDVAIFSASAYVCAVLISPSTSPSADFVVILAKRV